MFSNSTPDCNAAHFKSQRIHAILKIVIFETNVEGEREDESISTKVKNPEI